MIFVLCHLKGGFDTMQYVADLPTRRRGRLRSSTSNLLDVRPSRCVTVGDRSFATAGPRLWNSLPADVRSASSPTTFRRKLKLIYFGNLTQTLCYNYVAIVVLEVTLT